MFFSKSLQTATARKTCSISGRTAREAQSKWHPTWGCPSLTWRDSRRAIRPCTSLEVRSRTRWSRQVQDVCWVLDQRLRTLAQHSADVLCEPRGNVPGGIKENKKKEKEISRSCYIKVKTVVRSSYIHFGLTRLKDNTVNAYILFCSAGNGGSTVKHVTVGK